MCKVTKGGLKRVRLLILALRYHTCISFPRDMFNRSFESFCTVLLNQAPNSVNKSFNANVIYLPLLFPFSVINHFVTFHFNHLLMLSSFT